MTIGRTLTPDDVIAHDEWIKNNSLYFTAVRTIGDLVMKLDGHQPDHWDIVLNQLSIDLGMDL